MDLKHETRVEKAGQEDIDALVKLRLDYLNADHGSIDKKDTERILKALPDYFRKHLNLDLFAYVIREDLSIVSCAFLLVIEKPMSPAFINGRTGIVLNVFTCESYRRKGYARAIMDALPGSSFSVISFSNGAEILTPFTQDIVSVSDIVERLDMPAFTTSQGSSLNTAYSALRITAESAEAKKGN